MNVLMSFPVLIFHLCVFFGELSVNSFAYFKLVLIECLLLNCNSVSILDINPLSEVYFYVFSSNPYWAF